MNKKQETNEVPRRVRGSLLVKGQDCYEFSPFNEGESTQDVLKTSGKSKLYRTKGKKEPQMVAYLTVPAADSDPVASLSEILAKVTEGLEKKPLKRMRGKVLMDTAELRVTHNRKDRKLEVVMSIDLNETPNYNNRLINLMQQVSQCFAINQTSLARLSQ